MNELIPIDMIAEKICLIRNQKVMLDKDLAWLYGVETRVLNQSVKRHIKRFPDDFMFQLTHREYDSLISQFVTSKPPGSHFGAFSSSTEAGPPVKMMPLGLSPLMRSSGTL